MFSLLFSQQRDDQIKDAMKALKSGDITAAAFLDRLTFHESKVCDFLADFPEEIIEDLIIDENEFLDEGTSIENGNTTHQHSIDLTICPTCNDQKREVICMPCRHQYFCTDCYEKWSTVNPDAFDFIDEDGNVPSMHDNVPIEVKCPVCKQTISDVIYPIVA